MRRLLGIVFIVVLLPVGHALAAQSPEKMFIADGTVVEFKSPDQFKTSYSVLLLHNRSKVDAYVKKVSSCCGMGAVLLSPRRIPPGGAADVMLAFSAGALPERVNLLKKAIRIRVEMGGVEFTKKVPLRIVVHRRFTVRPTSLNFGTVKEGEDKVLSVTLVRYGADRLEVERLDYRDDLFRVSTAKPRRVAGGAAVDVVVALKKDAPPGRFMETISGRCRDGARFAFTAYGLVQGHVEVSPTEVDIGKGLRRDVTRTVSVIVRGDAGASVKSVSSSGNRVKASVWKQVVTRAGDKIFLVRITVPARHLSSTWREEVTVAVTGKKNASVVVPVVVRPPSTPSSSRSFLFAGVKSSDPAERRKVEEILSQYRRIFGDRGKKDGVFKVYYPGSKKAFKEFSFRNGMLDGVVRTYFDDGTLMYEQVFSGGRETAWKAFDVKGRLKKRWFFKEEKR